MSHKFGPYLVDTDRECCACKKKIKHGDYTCLITIGPGDDVEARADAARGRAYNAVAVEAHWDCTDPAIRDS